MAVETFEIELKTKGTNHVIDITPQVKSCIERSKIKNGIACVILPGSTGAITTIEYEPGVVSDLIKAIERIAPQDIPYEHDKAWGDGNGFSHVRSALLGTSFTVPFVSKSLILGTWQQIVFIECDNRPRKRSLIVQVVGE
ncbi:MAG: YjbQ family protein [Deferribacteres bacterium]|nr:YjbQ family protein [Deferribacteres bacterium]